jgi:CBS-domain-containing membrane protein
MAPRRKSFRPVSHTVRIVRQRLPLRVEFALAILPTVTVLLVLALVEVLSEQRLLFASLASSAFLIYLDPEHGTNRVRTLVVSQMTAAAVGWSLFEALGPGYVPAGLALILCINVMILFDVVHPPAVATAMSFALRAGDATNVALFGLAVGITAGLVFLQRSAVWLMARLAPGSDAAGVPR